MARITVLFVFLYAMYTKTTKQQKITADYIVQRYRWNIYQKKIIKNYNRKDQKELDQTYSKNKILTTINLSCFTELLIDTFYSYINYLLFTAKENGMQ